MEHREKWLDIMSTTFRKTLEVVLKEPEDIYCTSKVDQACKAASCMVQIINIALNMKSREALGLYILECGYGTKFSWHAAYAKSTEDAAKKLNLKSTDGLAYSDTQAHLHVSPCQGFTMKELYDVRVLHPQKKTQQPTITHKEGEILLYSFDYFTDTDHWCAVLAKSREDAIDQICRLMPQDVPRQQIECGTRTHIDGIARRAFTYIDHRGAYG